MIEKVISKIFTLADTNVEICDYNPKRTSLLVCATDLSQFYLSPSTLTGGSQGLLMSYNLQSQMLFSRAIHGGLSTCKWNIRIISAGAVLVVESLEL